MQQRIASSTAFRHSFDASGDYNQSIDHPERMMFFGLLFGVISWGLIGLVGWGLWALIN